MYICKFCKKQFTKPQSLAAHIRHCKKNPKFNEDSYKHILKESAKKGHNTLKEKDIKYTYKCICERCGNEYEVNLTEKQYNKHQYSRFCSRSCANKRVLTDEIKQKISNSIKHSDIFKKNNVNANLQRNLTKLKNDKTGTLEIINGQIIKHYKCKECGKDFTKLTERNIGGHTYCSAECKHKYLSEHTGGYRKGSGRGKSGWYKCIWCDSSWELAFVIYYIDHNLDISRCQEERKYIFNNRAYKYYPDFLTKDGIIEIKGFESDQWLAKLKYNPDVKVLYEKDIQPYIKYVIDKYGINFIELYDNAKPIRKNKKFYWLHKDGINTMIRVDKLDEYLNNGWVKGRICKKN